MNQKICELTRSTDPRKLSQIRLLLKSHEWEIKSADKSPWGITSRFACKNCGDEFVAMITSSRNADQETFRSTLEVSAGDVVLK